MNPGSGRGGHRILKDTKGLTEILSYVLLIGIVFVAIAALLVYGGAAIDDGKQTLALSQAEHGLTQFDSRASEVVYGDASVQRVDMGIGRTGGTLSTHDSGWLRVEVIDVSNATTETVTNTTLGSVTYERGTTTVAYQGGGVWRSEGANSVMVSPPEVHYRNETLSVPVVTVDGESVHSELVVRRDGESVQRYPNATDGWENKIRDAKVEITVRSRYYQAWGQYFEDSTRARVVYNHTANTVTAKFLALPSHLQPANGIIATSGPGKIELAGNGAYLDSYNSSVGNYAATASDEGTVKAAGDVNITGDATIDGTVRSGGYIALEASAARLNGDAYWTEGFRNDGTLTGTDEQITGVASLDPIDGLVDNRVATIRRQNDNSQTGTIVADELDISGSSGELEAGTYYLDRLALSGETLVLNTTDGDITIAVREDVGVRPQGNTGGNLTVEGNGTVRIFVGGAAQSSCQVTGGGTRSATLCVEKKSAVHIPGQVSTQLQLFGKQDFDATISGSSGDKIAFDGIVYAPAGNYGSGYTYVKQADVYGGVVTGNLTLGQYGAVHYDHRLEDWSFPVAPTVARVEFMYVTIHHTHVHA